jgi:hypothetical protein
MNIALDKIDLDILEAAYYGEPFHILCGMVHDEFTNISDLIPHVLRLQKMGLLEITKDPSATTDPNEKDLERIALNHEVYGTTGWPEGPTWSIKTTKKGFEYIKERFD